MAVLSEDQKIFSMQGLKNKAFHIYDMEKTVVDIVFYREKIGIKETKEVLITYLQRKDRNLNQLLKMGF